MRFKRFAILILLLQSIALLIGCGEKLEQKGSPEYIADIQQWHQRRENRLKKENGWLNLVGLYWLKEGKNTFGSAKDNNVIFPE